jgi:hypothetical protein
MRHLPGKAWRLYEYLYHPELTWVLSRPRPRLLNHCDLSTCLNSIELLESENTFVLENIGCAVKNDCERKREHPFLRTKARYHAYTSTLPISSTQVSRRNQPWRTHQPTHSRGRARSHQRHSYLQHHTSCHRRQRTHTHHHQHQRRHQGGRRYNSQASINNSRCNVRIEKRSCIP